MSYSSGKVDVIVIGGGFYGCCTALLLREFYDDVVVIEKEEDLLQRASAINQARVHNGYHYPRNLVTAYRSFVNFPRFIIDFQKAIVDDFKKLYAIARIGSKVNAFQFQKIYEDIKAPIKVAPDKYKKLFNDRLIEEVFLVKEMAFDCVILKDILKAQLEKAKVNVVYSQEVKSVEQFNDDEIIVELENGTTIQSKMVINCTYSMINKLLKNSHIDLLPMKHELTEMALIKVPDELNKIGITVMDGAFFSTMPYPSKGLHSLSHVRYTPHHNWNDLETFIDGHNYIKNIPLNSNYIYMVKDAQRYLPVLSESQYIESIYEIKSVLLQNELDDGRPILFCKDQGGIKNFYSIMGGKLDNIYDVLEMIADAKNSLRLKTGKGWKFWFS